MNCNNCNDMGHVSISVDCPECTSTNELALHDAAPDLLRGCEAAIIFIEGIHKLLLKRPDRFKTHHFQDIKKLSLEINKIIKKAEGK